MNFQELLTRMRQLDTPVVEEPNEGNAYGQAVQNTPPGEEIKIDGKGTGDIKREEVVASECGPEMGPSPMKQQDNVSMNVSMNGSGAGGIRDLIDILRNIDGEAGHMDSDKLGDLIGNMDHPMGHDHDKAVVIGDDVPVEEYANEPDEVTHPVDAVINTGTMDMHSPHKSYSDKPYRGDNPMAVESIKARLDALYNDVKNR